MWRMKMYFNVFYKQHTVINDFHLLKQFCNKKWLSVPVRLTSALAFSRAHLNLNLNSMLISRSGDLLSLFVFDHNNV